MLNVKRQRRGLFFAVNVLLGNAFLPLINNTKPAGFSDLYYAWVSAVWEVFCIIPIWLFEKRKQIKQNIISINKEASHSLTVSNETRQLMEKPSIAVNTSKKSVLWKLIFIGVIFSLAGVGTTYGLTNAGSIASSIALKISPIYAMIIGALYLKEKINFWQVFITIGLFTVLIYMGTKGWWYHYVGGIGHGLTKPLLMQKIISSPDIILIRNSIVMLILGISYVVLFGWVEFQLWTSPIHLFYMFLIGLNQMLMHWAWYRSITDLDLSLSSALVIPSPVLTTFFAIMITHETIYSYHIVGLVGSMVGLYLLLVVQPRNKN